MLNLVQVKLICPECGNKTTIFRKQSKQKEYLHRKSLYCYRCKKETNHIEVRNLDALIASLNFKDTLTEDEERVVQLVKKRSE